MRSNGGRREEGFAQGTAGRLEAARVRREVFCWEKT